MLKVRNVINTFWVEGVETAIPIPDPGSTERTLYWKKYIYYSINKSTTKARKYNNLKTVSSEFKYALFLYKNLTLTTHYPITLL